MFCVDLRTNSEFFLIQKSITGLYNRNGRCLLRGRKWAFKYRVSIKSFPDYKYLLQENYVEYKHIFLPLLKLVSKILCHVFIVFEKNMFLFHVVFL
jgi:hypothetical protein